MTRRILMIAFHYPPIAQSSGKHRTFKFAQYLAEFGWEPIVLTVSPVAYEAYDPNDFPELPGVIVKRTFAIDTARHLSIMGRYSLAMATPDRWISWWLSAVPTGLSLIRKYKPDVMWSTYPIATAHMIAQTLKKRSGIPWIADFRDPMTDVSYPGNPRIRKSFLSIEHQTVHACDHGVFTTPDTRKMYEKRFPDISPDHWSVIPNGYDEEDFAETEKNIALNQDVPHDANVITLTHTGLLYRSERNPEPFFQALSELKKENIISGDMLKIVLRASGDEPYYQTRLDQLNISDIVSLEPPIPHKEVLIEMMKATGLLLFQAANCNHQIPAKAYEYLRAKRPIFTLTDPQGNTAELLLTSGINNIAQIDSKNNIKEKFNVFIEQIKNGETKIAPDSRINNLSRHHRTKEFATILERFL